MALCDCGHDDQVHGIEGHEDYCETCGGKCRVGGFRTWQQQIDALTKRVAALEASFLSTNAEADNKIDYQRRGEVR